MGTQRGFACPLHGFEDRIGRLGPHERLGIDVGFRQVIGDARLQFVYRGVHPSLDLLF